MRSSKNSLLSMTGFCSLVFGFFFFLFFGSEICNGLFVGDSFFSSSTEGSWLGRAEFTCTDCGLLGFTGSAEMAGEMGV